MTFSLEFDQRALKEWHKLGGGSVLNVQEVDQNTIWIDVRVVFNRVARGVVVIITFVVGGVAGHLEL